LNLRIEGQIVIASGPVFWPANRILLVQFWSLFINYLCYNKKGGLRIVVTVFFHRRHLMTTYCHGSPQTQTYYLPKKCPKTYYFLSKSQKTYYFGRPRGGGQEAPLALPYGRPCLLLQRLYWKNRLKYSIVWSKKWYALNIINKCIKLRI